MTAIISVKIGDPQFEGQTKQKLGNSEAKNAVDSVVSEQLTYFLEQNPAVAKVICEKSIVAQRARAAARKADFWVSYIGSPLLPHSPELEAYLTDFQTWVLPDGASLARFFSIGCNSSLVTQRLAPLENST